MDDTTNQYTNSDDQEDQILDSNTGNNDYESRMIQEELSSKIFGGAQIGTGTMGANNAGFVSDMDSEDTDDVNSI